MFAIDWTVAAAGLLVGSVVGLTGMGGGALMTPILVLFFGISPTVAVASDLAASLFMKPFGALVHLQRRTVNGPLVKYLSMGSVPSAFAGAALIHRLSRGHSIDGALRTLLGVTLLLAASATVAKSALNAKRAGPPGTSEIPIAMKPLQTVAIGVIGGFVVGMTSVGSGSLVIVMLMLLYPRLSGSRLVGTDLAQAIPLVAAAALGHFVFGHIHFDLTASLLVGSIPGVYLGAQLSARAPDRWIRPALVLVLVASALKLLAVPNTWVGVTIAVLIAVAAGFALAGRAAERSAEEAKAPRADAGTAEI